MMKPISMTRGLLLLFALALTLAPAGAADVSSHKVADGVAVYLGLLPAEILLGHPKGHHEREMHGGVPAGENHYHLTVGLFDAASGKRLSNAQVKATVSELGLSGSRKKLESMVIAGTLTYGAYFRMSGPGPYRIHLEIRLPGRAQPIETEFEHVHARS
jgi:hypothetical protein